MSEAAYHPDPGQALESGDLCAPRARSIRPAIRPRVSVVIPARNEARNLPRVLSALPDGLHQVILVDGGSFDGTVATALACRPDTEVITQTRRGKGNALACGFAVATGDIIVTLDADGSADPAEIPRFVDALLAGADVVKGTRFAGGGSSADITPLRRVGNGALNLLVNLLYDTEHTDLCYGYTAFWRRMLDDYQLPPTDAPQPVRGDGFEIEALLTVRAARSGAKIAEVASVERRRVYGTSNLNAIRDGLRVARTIVAERRTPGPIPPVAVPAPRAARGEQPLPQPRVTADGMPRPMLSVSVVIACYAEERWDWILRAVESSLAQALLAEVVLVVDRNERLLARLRAHFATEPTASAVRVLPNDRTGGASGARNVGAFAATGDLLAFLDDDAWAEPTWLSDIVPFFTDAGVVGAGGAIDPIWPGSHPSWFPPEFGWVVGATYPAGHAAPVTVRNVWAGNMIVRRSAFVAVGGFREDFGKLNDISEPEDTELCIRIGAHAPDQRWVRTDGGLVHHQVPGDRSTPRFFLRRCWNEGVGKASLSAVSEAHDAVLTAEREYLHTVLPRGFRGHVVAGMKGDASGLARAGLMMAGTTATCLGFVSARTRARLDGQEADAVRGDEDPIRLPVLMYHSVPAETGAATDPWRVPLDELRRHLDVLTAEGWTLLGLTEAIEAVRRTPTRRIAAVTFDDGHADFVGGLGALEAAGAGATLYIPTGHVGLPPSTHYPTGSLSWAELRDVAARGVEVGSHAHRHRPLDVLDAAALRAEVIRSRAEIEDNLQMPARSFCFPFGYAGPRTRAAVAGAGYENGCIVGRRIAWGHDDVFAVPRLHVLPGMSDADVLELVESGERGWTPVAKRMLQPAWRLTRLGADRGLGWKLT